jgi:hypothetical protein
VTKNIKPIKETITPLKGCKASIYQHELSKNWWVRCRINGRYQIRSTGEVDKRDALKKGEQIYLDLLRTDATSEKGRRSKNARFSAVAISMNDKTKLQTSEKTAKNELAMINNHLIPYFKDKDINRIDYGEMLKFFKTVDEMVSVKKHTLGEPWKTATKRHLIRTFKKVLHHGYESGVLLTPPNPPRWTAKTITKRSRDYLTWNDYGVLMKSVIDLAKKRAKGHRTQNITTEIKCLINFMINSFIRPSDLKVLKHRHIEIKKDARTGDEWLRLTHPATKTSDLPMLSTQYCPDHYRELIAYRKGVAGKKGEKYLDPDDYVFMPTFRDDEDPKRNENQRLYALQTLGKCFAVCVQNTPSLSSKNVTLYSLRHTSIMFRLMYGDDIDTLYLARNARTSQLMIERFYAQYLTGDHIRERLHSMRNRVNLPRI